MSGNNSDDDDEYESLSFRASLSRERSALLQKLMSTNKPAESFSTNGGDDSQISPVKGPRTSSLKAQAFLKAAVPLRSPVKDSSDSNRFFPPSPSNESSNPSVKTSPVGVSSPASVVTKPTTTSSAVRAAAAAGLQRRLSSREQSTDSARPGSNGGIEATTSLLGRKVQFAGGATSMREASSGAGSVTSSPQARRKLSFANKAEDSSVSKVADPIGIQSTLGSNNTVSAMNRQTKPNGLTAVDKALGGTMKTTFKSSPNSVAARMLRRFSSSATSTTTTIAEHQNVSSQQYQSANRSTLPSVPEATTGTSRVVQFSSPQRTIAKPLTAASKTPGSDIDRQIKQRQEADEARELSSLLRGFGQ